MIKSIEAIACQISEISTSIEAQATATEKIAATLQDILVLMKHLADTFRDEDNLNK